MRDTLLHRLLVQCEPYPDRSFDAEDLADFSEAEVGALVRERLLLETFPDPPFARCPSRPCDGDHREVVQLLGQWFGVCSCERREPPLPLDPPKLVLWRLDLLKLARQLRARWDLGGIEEQLHERLILVGEADLDGTVVLGLFADEAQALDLLYSLPARLPDHVANRVVVTPSTLIRAGPSRELAALSVAVTHLRGDELMPVRSLEVCFLDLARPNRPTAIIARESFEYVESFRWVAVDGKEYTPSVNQSLVLARMHEIGEPTSELDVLDELVDAFRSNRFADVFKGSRLVPRFLIPLGKGMWKLKYY